MVSENTPKSEIGKISGQNWETSPMNSPKAFGELKILCQSIYLCVQPQQSKNNNNHKAILLVLTRVLVKA